jgi:hypothetical protein
MLKETILKIIIKNKIQEYCNSHTSRQREDLYDYLNKKLGLDLKVLDYKDKRREPARFACDEKSQEWETNYIVNKILKIKT